MKTSPRLRSLAPLTCSVALAACAPDVTAPVDDQGAESVVVPGLAPSVTVATTPTPLGLHGHFTPTTASGAAGELAEYSNGLDLAAAPSMTAGWDPASVDRARPDAFVTAAAGDRYSSAPAFALDLSNAEAGTARHLSSIDVGAAGQIEDFINTLKRYAPALGDVTTRRTDPSSSLLAFAPERGRWVSGRSTTTRLASGLSIPRWTTYRAPALDELRERGARVYCAAREAQRQQGDGAMGAQSAFSMNVLGKQIDFFVVEPSVVLDGPQRFERLPASARDALPDGAQAFDVPMMMGTRVTPIRGIGLPGLAEMRYPVVYVTGDSERATLGDAHTSTVGGATLTTYGRQWTTATHADAFAATGQAVNIAARKIPIFTMGAVSVYLGLSFDFEVGGVALAPGRSDVPEGRIGGFPGPARGGWTSQNGDRWFADGAWRTPPLCTTELCPRYGWDWAILPDGDPSGASAPEFQLTSSQAGAFDTRALQDDDHALDGRTGLTVTGTLEATVGVPRLGPFEVNIDGRATLSGNVTMHHVVREALTAERVDGGRAVPTTSITVRPRTTANAQITEADIVLHLRLDMGFFTARWDPTLAAIDPITLASYDSDDTRAWPESSVLRVSTGAESGAQTMLHPDARSHVPNGRNFAAMPDDVPTCLADRRPNPTTPAPRGHCDAQGSPATGNLCVYTQDPSVPADVCADPASVAASLASDPAQRQCLEGYYRLLCSPVSARDGFVLSHALDTRSEAAMSSFAALTRTCVNAFVPRTGDAHADAVEGQRFIDRFFPMSPCDDAAHLLSPSSIITASGDPSRPPPVTVGGACGD